MHPGNNTLSDLEIKEKSFTDIFDIEGGTQPPKSQFIFTPQEGYVRLLQIRDFGEHPVPTYIPKTRNLKLCKEDDVLIGRYGASVGRICTGMEGAYNVALTKVVPLNKMHRRFIYYILNSHNFQDQLRKIERSAQNGFNKDDLRDISLPMIDDYNSQIAITEYLDEILPSVKSNISRLKKAKRIIEKYKQAVLSAAVTGKLTDDWRQINTEIKDANSQMQIIQQQRITKTKAPSHNIDAEDFPQLPDKWMYVYFGNIVDDFKYGTSEKSDYSYKGTPVLRIPNVISQKIDLENLKYLNKQETKEDYLAKDGDILIVRSNGSRDLVGKNALVSGLKGNYAFASYLIRIRPKVVLPSYMSILLNSNLVRQQLFSNAKSAAGINNINTQELASMVVSLPPEEEQFEIVKEVTKYIDIAEIIEKQIEKAEKKVSGLNQSILAKVFSTSN